MIYIQQCKYFDDDNDGDGGGGGKARRESKVRLTEWERRRCGRKSGANRRTIETVGTWIKGHAVSKWSGVETS